MCQLRKNNTVENLHLRQVLRSLRFKILAVIALLFVYGLGVHAQTCQQQSGSHNFRRQGESFEIPMTLADCQVESLELRWSNGRNNGSLFHVTFVDSDNQAIFTKDLNGFLSGSFQFPFSTQPSYGTPWLMAVPIKVTIETARPFEAPAMISYRLISKPKTGNREPLLGDKAEAVRSADGKS